MYLGVRMLKQHLREWPDFSGLLLSKHSSLILLNSLLIANLPLYFNFNSTLSSVAGFIWKGNGSSW